MTAPIRPKERLDPGRYQRMRDAGFSDEEIIADGFELPAPFRPAPVRSALTGKTTEELAGEGEGTAWGLARGTAGNRPRGNPVLRATGRAAMTLGQGASLGFADEALGTAYGVLSGQGGQAGRDAYRAKLQEARDAAPALAALAEFTGGLALPAAKVAQAGKRGATLTQQMVSGAKAAIPTSTAAGVGYADGGVKERALGGAIGLGLGAATGAAVPAAFAGARQAGRYLGLKTNTVARERAADALQTVAEREKNPNIVTVRQGAQGRRMVDTSPSMQELGLDVARAKPSVERQMEEMARTRMGGQNAAIARETAEALDVPLIEADRAKASIDKLVRAREDEWYPKLWEAFPDPIQSPKFQRVWAKGQEHLGKRMQEVADIADLAGDDLSTLFGEGGIPTLKGLHEFRVSTRNIADKLRAKTQKLTPKEASLLRAMNAFQKRLDGTLKDIPGGKEYWQIRQIGRDGRTAKGALEAGEKGMSVEVSPQQFAKEMGESEKPRQFRQGMASDVLRRSDEAPEASKNLLRFAGSQRTQRKVRMAGKDGNTYTRNLQDIADMATTNKGQVGGKTSQKEVLPGARRAATALAFGEANLIGSLATGQGWAGIKNPFALAAGALGGKVLEGRRRAATERASEYLAKMLLRSADDPQAAKRIREASEFLQRRSTARMQRQGTAAKRIALAANQARPSRSRDDE